METENIRFRRSAISSRENVGCGVLQEKYNERIFDQLGDKCNTLATGVAQLLVENFKTWDTLCSGAICYVHDYGNKKYSLRLIDYDSSNLSSEKWRIDLPADLEFELTCKVNLVYITFTTSESKHYKLIFTSKTDAEDFFNTAEQLQNERRARDAGKRSSWLPWKLKRESKTQEKDSDKNEKRKTQFSKLDIGKPTEFRHMIHVGKSTLEVGNLESKIANSPPHIEDSEALVAMNPLCIRDTEVGVVENPPHIWSREAEVPGSPMTTRDSEEEILESPIRNGGSEAEVATNDCNWSTQTGCTDASEIENKRVQPRIPAYVDGKKVPAIVRRNTTAVLTELESAVLRRNQGLDRKCSDNACSGSDPRPRPLLLPKPRETKPPLLHPKPKLNKPPPLSPKPKEIRATTAPDAVEAPKPPTRIQSRRAAVSVHGHLEERTAAGATGNALEERTAVPRDMGSVRRDVAEWLWPDLRRSDTPSGSATRDYDGRELLGEQNVCPGGLSPTALNTTAPVHHESDDFLYVDALRLSRSPTTTAKSYQQVENAPIFSADAPCITFQNCPATEAPVPASAAMPCYSAVEVPDPSAVATYLGTTCSRASGSCSEVPDTGSWVRVDYLNQQRYGTVLSVGTVVNEGGEDIEVAAVEIEGSLPEGWENALNTMSHISEKLRLCSIGAVTLVPTSSLSEVHVYEDVQETGMETTIEEQMSLAGEMGYTANDFMEALCSEFRKGARGPFSSIDEMIDALCYVQEIRTVTSSDIRGTAEVGGIAEGGMEHMAQKPPSDNQESSACSDEKRFLEQREMEKELEKVKMQLDEARSKLTDVPTCAICLDARPRIVFGPCSHFICCESCSDRLEDCPLCRKRIQNRIKVYQ